MSSGMDFDVRYDRGGPAQGEPGRPFRVLLLADFSRREEPDAGSLATRPVRLADVDEFEGLMAHFAPEIRLSGGEVAFRELEDFHPDRLYHALPVFAALRDLRGRLLDPATFDEAARELRPQATQTEETPDSPAAEAPVEDDAGALERLLGKPAGGDADAPRTAAGTGGLSGIIKSIVEPHIVPEADPRQDIYVASLDEAIASHMRDVLRDPGFRSLEAAWRGLWQVVSGLETDAELTVHVMDVSREELEADAAIAGADLEASGLYRRIVAREAGEPWAAIAADLTFANEPADLKLLAFLGAVASQAGGPLLGAAHPSILGCPSPWDLPDPSDWEVPEPEAAARWKTLRESPLAPWIGLALPRILLRLPYGERGEEIDSFTFEEMPVGGDHEALLWGTPAWGMACLLSRSFKARGWKMEPGDHRDLADLPSYIVRDDEGTSLTPCAEVLWSERAGEAVLDRGLMPVLSMKNANAVRVLRFQSLGGALQGPWS
jgi:type VI secretion system protein ImpC